ncbi:MAG TPA: glycosyltransferase family 4 protein [Chloroflexota bacterium]|nr:glycosyltransferase family 4 protein [Chloroflexota bacterium]
MTAEVPWPPMGGAQTRNAYLAQALAEKHEVVVAAFDWGDRLEDPPSGVELHRVPWELPEALGGSGSAQQASAGGGGSTNPEPYSVAMYESPAMARLVGNLCTMWDPDVAVLTETAMARFRTNLPAGLPFVLDLHDVHAVKQARNGDHREASLLRSFESAAVRSAARTVCVSDLEARHAQDVLGARQVTVVPNGVDVHRFAPAEQDGDARRLVFTGSLHTQENIEAVIWLVRCVLPLVWRQEPTVTLDVVGAGPDDRVRALATDRVQVFADVPDTRPFLYAAGVAVAPLRNGGGTRLKVLEAAAAGRSVVSTSLGIEGLSFRPGHEVEVADDESGFAEAIVRLCRSPILRGARAAAGRRAALAYDWTLIGARWRWVVETAAGVSA